MLGSGEFVPTKKTLLIPCYASSFFSPLIFLILVFSLRMAVNWAVELVSHSSSFFADHAEGDLISCYVQWLLSGSFFCLTSAYSWPYYSVLKESDFCRNRTDQRIGRILLSAASAGLPRCHGRPEVFGTLALVSTLHFFLLPALSSKEFFSFQRVSIVAFVENKSVFVTAIVFMVPDCILSHLKEELTAIFARVLPPFA